MRFFGLLLSVALVVSMLSAAPVFAQTGSLEVICRGVSGAAEKDVKVTVLPLNSTKGKDKKTGATGVALFDKLDNGYYRVVARKDGFAPAFYEVAAIHDVKSSVGFDLVPGADRKLYFEDPMIERQAATALTGGAQAIDAGNYAEAERLIGQSLASVPNGADALFYLGVAQSRQKKYDQAAASFKKAAEVANLHRTIPDAPGQPSKQRVYEEIARNSAQQLLVIPVMRAQDAYEAKRFDEAAALYDEALQANPQAFALYTEKAMALTQAGKLEDADAAIGKALAQAPDDARAQQVKKAIDSRLANVEREKENARRQEANDLLNDGNKLLEYDVPTALQKFQEANDLTGGQQPLIWRQIARAQAKLHNDGEAVAAFRRAIELATPDQQESFQMSLAQYYLDAKRPDEALDLVASGSSNPEQKLLDLVAKTKNTNPTFAEAALERVLVVNPGNVDAYYDLGRLYYADGKEKDSRTKELLTRYVEIGPDAGKVEEAKNLLIMVNRRSN
jgi:tetratricopeptide (TPR) repeat protein